MKILFVEDDEIIRELCVTELEAELDIEIVELNSGNKAIEYLENSSEISLIISDYNMEDGTGGDLYSYVKSKQLDIPFIMATSESLNKMQEFQSYKKDHRKNFYLEKPFSFKDLLHPVREILEIIPAGSVPDYCRVKACRFTKMNNTCCDIFLKLSDDKYVKIIKANELYDCDQVRKYLNRDVMYLYIAGRDFVEFNDHYAHVVHAMFSQKTESIEKAADAQLAGMAYVHETIATLGINKKVVKMVDAVIKSSLSTLQNQKGALEDLIQQFMRNENFIYEHSMLAAYISAAIASEMQWAAESTIHKLVLAAILHDISWERLYEHVDDDIIEQFSYQSLDKYPWRVREMVKRHPGEVAKMVRGAKFFPPDVDWIVEQHHELPDGSGFPRGLDAKNIIPMSAIFIIAETFSRRVYGKKIDEVLIATIKDEFSARYAIGNFKKPLAGFLEIL